MIFPELSSIKTKRQALGIKQKQLAKDAEVSQSLIAKIESSKAEPSYTIAKRIFRVLESYASKEKKLCKDLAKIKPIFLSSKDSLEKASKIMKQHSFSQIPIIDHGRLSGTITESGIYSHLLSGKSLNSKITEIIEPPLPVLNSSTPIDLAMPLLKHSSAILIAEKGKIIGIITKSDLI